jgi:hypothetical protein
MFPCACPGTSLRIISVSVEAAVSDFKMLNYKSLNLMEDIHASFQSHVLDTM